MPVPCKGSNVFEATTSNGTVEMARIRRAMTWYIYGEQIIRVSTQLHATSKFQLLGYMFAERDFQTATLSYILFVFNGLLTNNQ